MVVLSKVLYFLDLYRGVFMELTEQKNVNSVNLLQFVFSGFADEPLSVVSDNGDVVFQVIDAGNGKNPEMRISKTEILFANVDSFKVVDPVKPVKTGVMGLVILLAILLVIGWDYQTLNSTSM